MSDTFARIMTSGFWKQLKRPIFALAPMADVTDAAFRRIIAKYSKYGGEDIVSRDGKFTRPHPTVVGGPDVFFTEFVSADGLDSPGRDMLVKDLAFSEAERPIVAQFFTGKPEKMEKAAALAAELGFDGVDINMGCPDRGVEKQGAGAALIKNPKLAREIIRAAKRGAPDLPLSVKTRIGYNKNDIETWLPELLKEELSAITLHARTRKEMSKVPAHWDVVARVVEIRDALGSETLILGNGDSMNIEDARTKAKETGADGVMLGKAIFGNPWLFSNSHELDNRPKTVSIQKKLEVMVEHTKLFYELVSHKNFAVMKKHYKAYANGFEGAKELRMKLMETKNASKVEALARDFLEKI